MREKSIFRLLIILVPAFILVSDFWYESVDMYPQEWRYPMRLISDLNPDSHEDITLISILMVPMWLLLFVNHILCLFFFQPSRYLLAFCLVCILLTYSFEGGIRYSTPLTRLTDMAAFAVFTGAVVMAFSSAPVRAAFTNEPIKTS